MWVFVRFLPLLIGRKIVDTDDAVWQLVLVLREVVELICAPTVTLEHIAVMQDKIEEYIERHMECFPGKHLIPKHHFITHYPALTVCCGPLIRLWTLRFESKHSYFKETVRTCQNFVNITKTCADKHQLLKALYSAGSLFGPVVQVTRSMPFNIDMYNSQVRFAIAGFTMLTCSSETDVAEQAVVRNIVYEKGLYVLTY
jgi:L-rhamnose mutarotase